MKNTLGLMSISSKLIKCGTITFLEIVDESSCTWDRTLGCLSHLRLRGMLWSLKKTSKLIKEKGFFKDLTDEMMLRISELLPLEKRGVYKNNSKKDYLLTKDN